MLKDLSIPVPIVRMLARPVFRYGTHPRLPFRVQRRVLDVSSLLQLRPPGTRVQPLTLGGRPAERISAGGPGGGVRCEPQGAVLYLHGGGYTVGSLVTHRPLGAFLAHCVSRPVYVLDYRLAPEHPYPAALDDAQAAFEHLAAAGTPPERIAVAGDSAGGGLALALALRLRDRDMMPAALALIAPWADPSDTPPRQRDLVIDADWARACAVAYRGNTATTDPGYAPLGGDLHGLPATFVQVDADELLYNQCQRLVQRLREANVATQLSVTHGLWHVAQLEASFMAPAAAAVRELSAFVAAALDGNEAPGNQPHTGESA